MPTVRFSTSVTVVIGLVAAACAHSSRLASVWREPTEAPGSFRRIVVVEIAGGTAHKLEHALVAELGRAGLEALPASAGEGAGNRDTLESRMAAERVDGVLVARLIGAHAHQAHYPQIPSYTKAPAPYARGWFEYYTLGVSESESGRDRVANGPVRLEANLYRRSDDRLVGSAMSEAFIDRPSSVARDLPPRAAAVIAGLIPPRGAR